MTLIITGIIYKGVQEFKYNQLITFTLNDTKLTLYRSDKSVTTLNFKEIKEIKEI